MNANHFVENAFQKIRTATGLSDVNEIVHRFLTREQTYSELLMAVSDNERKIENLRWDHEQQQTKLHDLQMSDKDMQKAEQQQSIHAKKALTPEIDGLEKEIGGLQKDKEKSDELNKKVNLIYDQVQGWSSKVIQKIDQQFGENIQAYEHTKTLAFLFDKIAEATCK